MGLSNRKLIQSFALAALATGALTGCAVFGAHNTSSAVDVETTARETWERNGYNVLSLESYERGGSVAPEVRYNLEKDGARYSGSMTCFLKWCHIKDIKRQGI